tara:strand:- start:63 stop:284 length:222 start_codon:yes stop_codon:yes gene_type:complete
MFHSFAGSFFCCLLRREWGRFTRTFKPNIASRSPRDHISFLVTETDDGVVKRAFDMGDAVADILSFFPARPPR